ncbi:MAG: hypothetical protein J5601_07475, partial [Elusimicrobiaceae bacterium]|nr:hypothetical protein [Elusimicrobiaceae bacterium]
MKKLLIALLICCCVSPLYAQRGRKFFPRKKSVTVSRVQAALARTREKTTPTNVSHIQIIDLPDKPLVKLGGATNNTPAVLSAQMLIGADSWILIHPIDAIGRYTAQTFLPEDILENKESFYRGMRLGKLDEVKNLLVNGLELDKTNYSGEIYASLQVSISLWYATIGNENLPVLIQIPATETLRSYAPEAFPTEGKHAPKAFRTGEVCVFRRDIPARFISNIWVFLEVNGEPGWYKVTLEDGELVFTPAPSRVFEREEIMKQN